MVRDGQGGDDPYQPSEFPHLFRRDMENCHVTFSEWISCDVRQLLVNDAGDRSFLTKRPFLDRVFNALRMNVDEWGTPRSCID
jgi:hypothetical protein